MQSADILQREISLKISYTTQSNVIFSLCFDASEAKRSELETILSHLNHLKSKRASLASILTLSKPVPNYVLITET